MVVDTIFSEFDETNPILSHDHSDVAQRDQSLLNSNILSVSIIRKFLSFQSEILTFLQFSISFNIISWG